MFNKLKAKLEEARQTPTRLSAQSTESASSSSDTNQSEPHYSSFVSAIRTGDATPTTSAPDNIENNTETNAQPLIDLSDPSSSSQPTNLDQFTLMEEDETPNSNVTSPSRSIGSFQTVDLSEGMTSSTPNLQRTRRSSSSSFQGDISFTNVTSPPPYLFNPQSDLESASEFEDSSGFEQISKTTIIQAFQKFRLRYHKYRGRYSDLLKAYQDLEKDKEKIKLILSEQQDKALRRMSELREEIQLDKQAKADLEVTFRIMLEEKDEMIQVLKTQNRLLKEGITIENIKNPENSAAGDGLVQVELNPDVEAIKEKNKRLEVLLTKCKETIKANKERVSNLTQDKENLKKKCDELQQMLENKPGEENSVEVKTDEDKLATYMKEKETELNSLRDLLEKTQEEKNKLQSLIDDSAQKFEENFQRSTGELTIKNEEISKLKKNFKTIEERLIIAEQRLSETSEASEKLTKTEEMKEERFLEINNRLEKRNEDVARLETENSELNSTLEERKTQDETIKKQIEELEEKISKLNAEKEETEKQTKDLTIKLEKGVESFIVLKETFQQKHNIIIQTEQIKSMDDFRIAYKQLVESINSQAEILQAKLNRATKHAEEQGKISGENKLMINNLIQEKEELQEELITLQSQKNLCDKEIEKEKRAKEEKILEVNKLESYVTEMEFMIKEKDEELSKSLSEKLAIEESLDMSQQQTSYDDKISQTKEEEGESEVLRILTQRLERELSEKNGKLQDMDDELQMEKVLRQSSIDSEQEWVKKCEESDMIIKQLQDALSLLECENQEKIKVIEELNESKTVEIKEVNELLKNEVKKFKEGEEILQKKLDDLKEMHQTDKEKILKELEELNELKVLLEREVEERNKELCMTLDQKEGLHMALNQVMELVLDESGNETNDLKSLPEQVKSKMSLLDESKNHLMKEKEELQDKLKKLSEKRKEEVKSLKQSQMESLMDLRNKTSQTVSTLRETISSLREELDAQKENFDKYKNQLQTQSEQQVAKMNEQIERSRKELENNYFNQLETIQLEFHNLQVEMKNKESVIEEMRKTFEEAKEQMKNDFQVKLDAYENQLNSLSNAKEEISCKYDSSFEENRDLEKEVQKLKSHVEELKLQLDKNVWTSDENEKIILDLRKELEINKGTLVNTEKELESVSLQMEREMKAISDQVDGKVNEVIQLEQQIAKLNEKYEQEKSSHKKVKEEMKNEVKVLEMKFVEKEKEQMILVEAKIQLEKLLDEKTKDFELYEQKNNETMKENLIQWENEKQRLTEEHQMKVQELKKKAEKKLAQIKKQIQSTTDDTIAGSKAEVVDLQLQVSKAEEALQGRENRIQKLQETFQQTQTDMEKRIVDFESQIKTNLDSYNEEKNSWERKIIELQEMRVQLEEKLKDSDKEKAKCKEECEAKMLEMEENHVKQMETLEKEVSVKNAQIDESLLVAQQNASDREKNLEKTKIEMKKLVIKLKKREDEVDELRREICEVKESSLEAMKKEYEEKLLAKDEEFTAKVKQLVADFTEKLGKKEQEQEETLYSSIEKLQMENSHLEKEYQAQIKDLLIDLREKETALENLTATSEERVKENEEAWLKKVKDYEDRIVAIQMQHKQQLHEIESKTKTAVEKKLDEQSEKYEEEIRELTKEWKQERKLHDEDERVDENKELEEHGRLTAAAMESSTTSNELLRQEVMSLSRENANVKAQHRNEVCQLQNEICQLKRLLDNTTKQLQWERTPPQGPLLNDPSEMEYLRNVLFEYMMGRQTTTLAKVIAAVVKFSDYQTQKVLEWEESRHNLFAHLLKN